MSEEVKEEVQLAENQTTSLQEKVGKLEKQLIELKSTTQAKLELLKGKVQSLHAKNLELIEKAKQQAFAVKETVTSFSLVQKVKSLFAKAKKNKAYVYYRSGDDVGIIKGYTSYAKTGLVRIEDAETISYGVDDMEHASYIGIAIIPFSSISLIKGE